MIHRIKSRVRNYHGWCLHIQKVNKCLVVIIPEIQRAFAGRFALKDARATIDTFERMAANEGSLCGECERPESLCECLPDEILPPF